MDKQIAPGSVQSYSSAVDYFTLPPTDVTTINSELATYWPLSNFKDNTNPIQFTILGSASHHLQLDTARLYVKLKIVKTDDKSLTSADEVAPCFNFFPALWESCDVQLNGHPITRSSNYYSFRHHIKDVLTTSESAKKTWLSTQLYYPDSVQDTFDATNKGYLTRREFSSQSSIFEVSGKVSDSIFTSNRWLPNNVELKITLRRALPEFSLVGKAISQGTAFPYAIKFEDVQLQIRRHIVNPTILADHQRMLSSGKRFQFPIRVHEIKTFVCGANSSSVVSETLFSGVLPELLILTFIDSKALIGSVDYSCFNFQHFGLQSVSVTINGENALWRQLEFENTKKLCLSAYQTLFAANPGADYGIGITRDEFLDGNFMIVLDLSPFNRQNRFQITKSGQLQVELKFKAPLTKPCNCLILAQSATVLQIDNNRNIYSDAALQF